MGELSAPAYGFTPRSETLQAAVAVASCISSSSL